MPLVNLLIVLALVGFVVWLITTYIPMPSQVRTLIIVVAVLIMCIWVLGLLGFTTLYVGHHP